MKRRVLLIALIAIVAVLSIALFALYSVYKPLEAEGETEASSLMVRAFLLYSGIMVATIACLLVAFYVEIYVLKPRLSLDKVRAQEWVVKGEVEIENELDRIGDFLKKSDHASAKKSYKKAMRIYSWLKHYEISDEKKQDYYIKLDKVKTEMEGAKA